MIELFNNLAIITGDTLMKFFQAQAKLNDKLILILYCIRDSILYLSILILVSFLSFCHEFLEVFSIEFISIEFNMIYYQ
jgi:hypothetical protein